MSRPVKVDRFDVQHPDYEDFWGTPDPDLSAHRTRTNRPDLDELDGAALPEKETNVPRKT